MTAGFIADPDAIVLAVAGEIEPQLEAATVLAALQAAAPTRAQRRRLAHALSTDPALLTSSRPEGPPQVERLIRALRERGAERVALPRCAQCGRERTLPQTHQSERICAVCALRLRAPADPCVRCGKQRPFARRDRDGRALCRGCARPRPDPLEEIRQVISAVDPARDHLELEAIIRGAAPRPAQRLQVFWQLQERPGLLTGEGAYGSPRIIALIEALIAAGVHGVVAPPCPSCDRSVPLRFQRDGLRCCRSCYSRAEHASCCVCGRVAAVCSRTADGRPVCGACFKRDHANHEVCDRCGRAGQVYRRATLPGSPRLCRRCYRAPIAVCTICGHRKPCLFADTGQARCENCTRRMHPVACSRCGNRLPVAARTSDGAPLCRNCIRRREPCAVCGHTRLVCARSPRGALCKVCYANDPVSFRPCADCGTTQRLYHHGLCPRCAGRQQLLSLLAPDGAMSAEIEPVFTLLADSEPRSLLVWLSRSHAATLLAAIGRGTASLTHESLDRHEPNRAVAHLRAILVAGAVLSQRDENLASFEQWLPRILAAVQDAGERRIVRGFATWHVLRRLRAKAERSEITGGQAHHGRGEVRAAVHLIGWLHERGCCLADCTQADVDHYVAEGPTTRYNIGAFLKWTGEHRHTAALEAPRRKERTAVLIEQDERWAVTRRLLHGQDLPLEDRVAGLLVLLFGQTLSTIARIRRDQLSRTPAGSQLLLGSSPLHLPAPLDALLHRLAETHRGHAAVGNTDQHPWLFPGGRPGSPRSPSHMGHRLKRLGIYARPARNTTLMELAGQMPPVVLTKLLGIPIETASRWHRRADGPGGSYAAEIARRAAATPSRNPRTLGTHPIT